MQKCECPSVTLPAYKKLLAMADGGSKADIGLCCPDRPLLADLGRSGFASKP